MYCYRKLLDQLPQIGDDSEEEGSAEFEVSRSACMDGQTGRQTVRQQTDRQTDNRQRDRQQTDREIHNRQTTDRQTDR